MPHALVNGRFVTMDPLRPTAEALVVERGRIAAVGDRALVNGHAGTALDLGGRLVLPGFIDSHTHLSISALHARWADLSRAATPDDVVAALREQAAAEPSAPWVRAAGWDDLSHGLHLDRHVLDEAGLDRPVMVAHVTLHQCVVDSHGLDVLGIDAGSADPAGGVIVRDEAGRPTGGLLELAWSDAHVRSLEGYDDPDRWGDLIEARARALLAEGITAIHDAACSPAAEAVYRQLAREARLPISVLVMSHPSALLRSDLGARLDGPPTGEGDELLRVGPVKLFADGGVAPAIELEVGGQRVDLGIRLPDVAEHVSRAVERGWRVAVHAIGNAAIGSALDAFAAASRAHGDGDHRFRIEHLSLPTDAHLAEMRALGVVASVQPAFIEAFGDALHVHPDLAPLMEQRWMPWCTVAEAGIALAASSDDPCAPFGPIVNSVPGATRRTALGRGFGLDESLPYEDWLRAYTIGSAFAGGQEGERGTLSPGKRADMVVLDGELDPHRPPRVAETWVAGERVWSAARTP